MGAKLGLGIFAVAVVGIVAFLTLRSRPASAGTLGDTGPSGSARASYVASALGGKGLATQIQEKTSVKGFLDKVQSGFVFDPLADFYRGTGMFAPKTDLTPVESKPAPGSVVPAFKTGSLFVRR